LLRPLLFPLPYTVSTTPEIRCSVSPVDPSHASHMFLAKIISATDGTFSYQLDRGIDTIPYILGSSSGPAHICHAPSIYPAVAVHSCVFWIYRPDSFLCSGGMSTITSLLSSRFHSEILSSPYFSEYQKLVTGSI
jgi:hypothetical protein